MCDLLLAGSEDRLSQLSFLATRKLCDLVGPDWIRDDTMFCEVARQLEEYFAGTRRQFDLSLHINGDSNSFSRSVWNELQRIPYGKTCTYREIAERIGRPKAYRAVGQANHRNPVAIVIPCHRVIGSDGTLTGFGGGLATKEYLLQLEKSNEATHSEP